MEMKRKSKFNYTGSHYLKNLYDYKKKQGVIFKKTKGKIYEVEEIVSQKRDKDNCQYRFVKVTLEDGREFKSFKKIWEANNINLAQVEEGDEIEIIYSESVINDRVFKNYLFLRLTNPEIPVLTQDEPDELSNV